MARTIRTRRRKRRGDTADGGGEDTTRTRAKTPESEASSERVTCPECDGTIREKGIESVCTDCGLVVREYEIDHGPEWRSFQNEETSSERTGGPRTMTRHDRGLGSKIGRENTFNRQMNGRHRRWNSQARFRKKAERNQAYANGVIKRAVSQLGLGHAATERACSLFASAQEDENLAMGRSLEMLAAASIYTTCRMRSLPHLQEEVAEAVGVDRQELRTAYLAMQSEMGLQIEPPRTEPFVVRLASTFDVAPSVRATALSHTDMMDTKFAGRNPAGRAAGLLYAVAQETPGCDPPTQKELAEVARVNAQTIRNVRDDLLEQHTLNDEAVEEVREKADSKVPEETLQEVLDQLESSESLLAAEPFDGAGRDDEEDQPPCSPSPSPSPAV